MPFGGISFMKNDALATPCLARLPLRADRQESVLLIVHTNRAVMPEPGLRHVVEFEDDRHGGFISAAQAVDGRWGYISGQGQWLIAPTLDNARGFTEDGLARFCRDGRWGYVNLLAQEVIAPQFEDARPLRHGLAGVRTAEHTWRVVDRQGQFTSDATFSLLYPFGPVGLALAQPQQRSGHPPLLGYVDHRGQWMIAPRFAQAHPFDEQAVTPASVDGHSWGLINTEGEWVLQPCYARIDPFNSEGLAFFAEHEPGGPGDAGGDVGGNACGTAGGHGYLNHRGKVAVKGGRHLSPRMVCGTVANSHNGARFLDSHGKPLPAPALAYATDFRAEMECAVALLAGADQGQPAEHGTASDAPAPWGLLHTSGRFVPAPPGLLEPLTDSEGWIPNTQPDTALTPFICTDGDVAWIDREGQVVWRAHYSGGQATLQGSQGQTLWRSPAGMHCHAPQPFFAVPDAQHLEALASLDSITALAHTLAAQAEDRLHRLAQGLPSAPEGTDDSSATRGPEHSDCSEQSERIHQNDPGDQGEDRQQEQDRHHASALHRVMRAYLSGAHHSRYEFLGPQRQRSAQRLRQALLQHLQAHLGLADPDPEHAAPGGCSGIPMAAWWLPLRQPLPTQATGHPSVNLPEANGLWLSLYPQAGTGDGDAWWELWLMAAPSVDALLAAQHARSLLGVNAAASTQRRACPGQDLDFNLHKSPHHPRDNGGSAAARAATAAPCRATPTQGTVPSPWLDESAIDAALQADPGALKQVPPALQTPERLEALVRSSVERAVQIPPYFMPRDALLLARELYAGHPLWDAKDERCSQVPTQWQPHSLDEFWGCLLTPAWAERAVQAGAPLSQVPHWLRTPALEHTALNAHIENIRYIAPHHITPALAERAVRHPGGRLIAHLPAALLSPALCLASAQTEGLTLQDMPPALRTVPVCAAALQSRHDVFHAVPRDLAVQVATQLIEADLAQARTRGEARQGSAWHVQRAWAHLWTGRPAQAIEDVTCGLPHARGPLHAQHAQHAHYVLARAYRALGQLPQAALHASTVLSLQAHRTAPCTATSTEPSTAPYTAPYTAPWTPDEDTRWLAPLARSQLQNLPEAELVAQLHNHPRTLADIPRAHITHAMVDAAVQADADAVRFVPKRLMTPARYALAVRQGAKVFEQIPPTMLSEEACVDRVREAGGRLQQVPPAWRTLAVCAHALRSSPLALAHVPPALRAKAQQAAQALPRQQQPSPCGNSPGAQEGPPYAAPYANRYSNATASWQGRVLQGMQRVFYAGGPRPPPMQSMQSMQSLTQSPIRPPEQPPVQPPRQPVVQSIARPRVRAPSPSAARSASPSARQRPTGRLAWPALLGVLALVLHALVSAAAWRAEGAGAGLATFVLVGFADAYWAWRFAFDSPAEAGLAWAALATLAACAAVLCLVGWNSVHRRATRTSATG
jgi:hypothetical protein